MHNTFNFSVSCTRKLNCFTHTLKALLHFLTNLNLNALLPIPSHPDLHLRVQWFLALHGHAADASAEHNQQQPRLLLLFLRVLPLQHAVQLDWPGIALLDSSVVVPVPRGQLWHIISELIREYKSDMCGAQRLFCLYSSSASGSTATARSVATAPASSNRKGRVALRSWPPSRNAAVCFLLINAKSVIHSPIAAPASISAPPSVPLPSELSLRFTFNLCIDFLTVNYTVHISQESIWVLLWLYESIPADFWSLYLMPDGIWRVPGSHSCIIKMIVYWLLAIQFLLNMLIGVAREWSAPGCWSRRPAMRPAICLYSHTLAPLIGSWASDSKPHVCRTLRRGQNTRQ